MKRLVIGLSSLLLSAGLVASATLSAQPGIEQQLQGYLGGTASAMLHLITPSSPVLKEEQVAFVVLDSEGIVDRDFEMPRNSVIVVTDVVATNCRGDSGRYVAALKAAGSPSWKLPIYFNTEVDGEQKVLNLTSGIVFTEMPEVQVSVLSKNALCVEAYGYLARDWTKRRTRAWSTGD